MNNLLSAEFSRLFRTKLFYIVLASCVGISLVAVYYASKAYDLFYADQSFLHLSCLQMSCFLYAGIVSAFFVSLFIGKEYSDGTIRNKLISGHSRISVYIADFVVCFAAELIISSVCVFIMTLCSRFSDSINYFSVSFILKTQLIGISVTAVYTAIFLLLTFLMNSRSKAVTASMILAVILLFFGDAVYEMLLPTETLEEINFTVSTEVDEIFFEFLENGADQEDWDALTEMEQDLFREKIECERGRSLAEAERNVLLVLNDVLPYCQTEDVCQYSSNIRQLPERSMRYILCDCSIMIITTALGIFIFKRQDIK